MPAHNRKDLTGQRFGKLVVKGFSHIDDSKGSRRKSAMWACECDCGNTGTYSTTRLNQTGKYVSCGCVRRLKYFQLTRLAFA